MWCLKMPPYTGGKGAPSEHTASSETILGSMAAPSPCSAVPTDNLYTTEEHRIRSLLV